MTRRLTAMLCGLVCAAVLLNPVSSLQRCHSQEKETSSEQAQDASEATDSEETDPEPAELGSDALPGVEVKLVLEGLNNPTGLAIQPETGVVFIADSGNHQVVKLVDGKAEAVITDFPNDVYGPGPKVNVGPLGLLFLSKNRLVVGGGGLPDGEELLRVYELPEDGKPIKAEEGMLASFKLEANGDVPGEGNFYGLAASPTAIYVSCNGDDNKGWVSKAPLEGLDVTGFERFLATKEATQVDGPVAVAISPEGYLVVGQMGEIDQPADSLITFYDVMGKGEMLLNLQSGLHDICAIIYSKRGQMYALDYAWNQPAEGGLFQILDDETSDSGMQAKRIVSLDKPTAMAFDADGSLYVTIRGVTEENNSSGKLIQVTSDSGL